MPGSAGFLITSFTNTHSLSGAGIVERRTGGLLLDTAADRDFFPCLMVDLSSELVLCSVSGEG